MLSGEGVGMGVAVGGKAVAVGSGVAVGSDVLQLASNNSPTSNIVLAILFILNLLILSKSVRCYKRYIASRRGENAPQT
jgi:hypothetical protein